MLSELLMRYRKKGQSPGALASEQPSRRPAHARGSDNFKKCIDRVFFLSPDLNSMGLVE